MSAIGWTAIEGAIAAWCLSGSGLPEGQVIWSYQGGPRPTPPYLALSLTDIRRGGQSTVTREFPTDPEPGSEIRRLHRNSQMATLSLQLFADGATGETGAVARLHDTLESIDIHVNALDTAGIGIGDIGAVTLVAGRVNTLLEPRAIVPLELLRIVNNRCVVRRRFEIRAVRIGLQPDMSRGIANPRAE